MLVDFELFTSFSAGSASSSEVDSIERGLFLNLRLSLSFFSEAISSSAESSLEGNSFAADFLLFLSSTDFLDFSSSEESSLVCYSFADLINFI